MKQIRFGTFETNSSSTHSLCVCTKQDYINWQTGSKIYDTYDDQLYDKSDINIDEIDEDPYRYKEYHDRADYLEFYDYSFSTPSGDEMVAFGWYGYDG